MSLDVAEVAPGLWIGSAPPTGAALRDAGFDSVVLCAEEYQPPASMFHGVQVVRAPFDDDPLRNLTDREKRTVQFAVDEAASRVLAGHQVLVTCRAGIDRSGLVTGLALWKLTGWPGRKIISAMRAVRPAVLTLNRRMKSIVASLPARHR